MRGLSKGYLIRAFGAVFVGSSVGGGLRLGIELCLRSYTEGVAYLGAVVFANTLGTALLGYLHGQTPQDSSEGGRLWRLGLTTGLCGGMTTFSALAWEQTVRLQEVGAFSAMSWLFLNLVLAGMFWCVGVRLARPGV